MPHHIELKYWSNGQRRCDFYLEDQEKSARKTQRGLEAAGVRTQFSSVTSTHSIEKEFREIRQREATK